MNSKWGGLVIIALIIGLTTAACGLQPSPAPTPTQLIETRLTAAERLAIFDKV